MLDRKLRRDLYRIRWQAVSIALVVACGIAIFFAARTTHYSLESSRADYCELTRFPDVFVSLKRAPEAVTRDIARLDGVAAYDTRIIQEITLDLPGLSEPAIGRIHSIPAGRSPEISRILLLEGSWPVGDQVLVNDAFAKAHQFRIGNRITGILQGRRRDLTVSGIAITSEYIASIRRGNVLPDDRHYGVLWMEREAMAAAFDMSGSFNDLVLRLSPGMPEARLIGELDRLLEPWGGLAYSRTDQMSYRFVSDELEELRAEAAVVPVIFLAVAAFLVNIVLSRLVRAERTQIATLKALGYGNRPIIVHYVELALVISTLGSLLGLVIGYRTGVLMTSMYADFFRFPVFEFRINPLVPLIAVVVSYVAALVGVGHAVREAVRMTPAEAMQPPVPPIYRRTVFDLGPFRKALSQQARMIFREVSRHPVRTGMSSLGIAAALAILVSGSFWLDAIDYIMEVQFSIAQREDATVSFNQPLSERVVREVAAMPGVITAEGFRSVAVAVRAGNRMRRVGLIGLPRERELKNLVNQDLYPVDLPHDGILVTERLATALGIGLGDPVWLEVQEGTRPRRSVTVAGIVDELVGLGVYMEIGALNRLLGEGEPVSAVLVKASRDKEEALYRQLKHSPAVESVAVKRNIQEIFRTMTARYISVFSMILAGFGAVMVIGVVFNSARILLAEKARDFASLRVLGFTRDEIFGLLLGELSLQIVLGIPAGLVFGYGIAAVSVQFMGPEMIRIPLVIAPSTYGYSVMVVLGGALLSIGFARRELNRLDLVAVLKSRE